MTFSSKTFHGNPNQKEAELTTEWRTLQDASEDARRVLATEWKAAVRAATKVEDATKELRNEQSLLLSDKLTAVKKKRIAVEDLEEVDELLGRSYDKLGYLLKIAIAVDATAERNVEENTSTSPVVENIS